MLLSTFAHFIMSIYIKIGIFSSVFIQQFLFFFDIFTAEEVNR